MPRAPGRIERGGEPELADRLVEALLVAGRDREVAESLTHPFHTYPARMHPATARALVELFCDRAPPGAVVVDPFAGSGTTLVEARAAGVGALGIDLNPLAVLIARAKTWTAPRVRLHALRTTAGQIAGAVFAAGKAARRSGHEAPGLRRVEGFDPNARNRRLARWFLPHVRRELELIAGHLDELRAADAELADVLTATLSAILYKVSSRTSDTDPTWIDRQVARGAPARLFAQRAELLAAGLIDLSRARGAPGHVIEADARRLAEHVAPRSAWAVITSPPYVGTYDYAEHQRLRFDFLGLRHRAFEAGELGARRHANRERDARRPIAESPSWQAELGGLLDGIATALAPGRYAALVIGDSIAGGVAHHALDDVRAALPGSLDLVGWASQARPMLGGAEVRAFGDRPKAEHVIVVRAA